MVKKRDEEGMNKTKRFFISVYNWIIFSVFTARGFFGKDTPETLLKLISKFIALEAPYYPYSQYLGRDMKKSARLLEILVDSYLETKSETVLNQIFVVLKEELVRRKRTHGRKQFPCG